MSDVTKDVILDEYPLYSKVRVVFDFTEGGFSVFNHSKSYVKQNLGKLTAFSYATEEGASQAGFDPSTPVSESETNIEKKFEVPGGGVQKIYAVSATTEGLLLIPADASDRKGCTKVEDGSHTYSPDVLDAATSQTTTTRAGSAHDLALRLVNRCFVPFLQYGKNGYVSMLGQLQIVPGGRSIDDGRGARFQGPALVLDNPLEFGSSGKYANLQMGLMLKRDIITPSWDPTGSGAPEDPGKTTRKLLGYAAAAVAPAAAGVVMAVMDVTLWFHGPRLSLAGN